MMRLSNGDANAGVFYTAFERDSPNLSMTIVFKAFF